MLSYPGSLVPRPRSQGFLLLARVSKALLYSKVLEWNPVLLPDLCTSQTPPPPPPPPPPPHFFNVKCSSKQLNFHGLQPFSCRKGANSRLFNYVLCHCHFRMSWCKDTNEKESIQHLTIGTLTRYVYEPTSLLNQATIVRVCYLRKLLWATRGARNPNLQVAFTHERNVCS